MSYGYNYGAPQGYYPPPPNSQHEYPAYPAPSYPANDPHAPYASSHENATAQSYEYNRHAIPGLGLNVTGHPNPPQGVGFPPNTNFVPLELQPPGSGVPDVQPWQHHAVGVDRSSARIAAGPAREDGSEQGELSDGEMEDIYEPRSVGDSGEAGAESSRSDADNTGSQVKTYGVEPSNAAARERSGSYSPYLSPRELHQYQSGDESAVEVLPSEPVQAQNTPLSVSEAKKRAQDAVSRLWPLNVRFHHYVDEGIDGSVVQDLFQELGLEISIPKDAPAPHAPNNLSTISGTDASQTVSVHPTKSPALTSAEPSQGLTDKSETRKDRIARLLAAKGTKEKAPSTVTPVASPPKAPKAVPAMKTQSDKSKLLQQKMEALERSREKLAQERSRLEAASAQNKSEATADQPSPSVQPISQAAQSEEVEQVEAQPGVSIPGLFLSSNPKDSQPSKSLPKRPVASDFNDSASGPFKRPFGQTRDSRPFLIDVSDDEDDEEMDIDSTGRRSPSAHRASSPTRRTTSFRDHPALPGQVTTRQLSSPGGNNAHTPPTGVVAGRPDLESMNKKIEAMKRKIAEAEARKKTKLSQDGSPAPPPLNGQADERATETPSTPDLPSVPAESPSTAGLDVAMAQSDAETFSQKLPKPSELRRSGRESERRSRSRAASERLPLIEAHRREQLLKLQALQAQVTRIETQIAEDLKEEARLREEAEQDSGSDMEQDQQDLPMEAEPVPSPQVSHSPQTEAIEASVESSDDENVAMDQASTPDQAPRSPPKTGDETKVRDEPVSSSDAKSEKSPGYVDPTSAITEPGLGRIEPEADDAEDESSGEASDLYEPPEAEVTANASLHTSNEPAPEPVEDLSLDTSDNDIQGVGETLPESQQISTGQDEPTSEAEREVDVRPDVLAGAGLMQEQVQQARESSATSATRTTFTPYESPLQHFRAYRFHPQYNQSVPGGLRSLTYSNKIDMRMPLCPDQLAGRECPRGAGCDYQHFENIQLQDDQILLQLGDSANFEAEQKVEFINGLRELLTDFRNRKVKDFKAISEGIIEYRARFNGDKTKVLPLGNVPL